MGCAYCRRHTQWYICDACEVALRLDDNPGPDEDEGAEDAERPGAPTEHDRG